MFQNNKAGGFRQKYYHFMQGRYGADQLSRFLIGVAFILMILSMFFNGRLRILYWPSLVLLIYVYTRIFSRNIPKQYAMNQKYLVYRSKFLYKVNPILPRNLKKTFAEHKMYHIYKCPNCTQKIRVPRGKGKIAIRCPKCGTEFIKKS
ncbi:MAG: hypothetical protein PHP50_12115 [Lachnospiraceae bacterium]|nr:hypothetical protein [Lachnospiraceae bacterium]